MKALLVALNAQYMHTNLAVRQIAAAPLTREACEAGDWTVDILEAHINLPFRRVLQDIFRESANVVCFSAYIWNIDYALRLSRALHLAAPGARIYLGGPEAMFAARALLAREAQLAGVMTGEGESSFGPLLDAERGAMPFEEVPGLAFRAPGGSIMETEPAPPLPSARWSDVYANGIAGLEDRILYIETSRGCPYRCKYCLSSLDSRVRALSAPEAARRLIRLADAGAKLVKLVDRTFNFDRARANEIWSRLSEHAARTGARTRYHFEIGAHLIDEHALRALANAPKGLFQFEVGIQTTDEAVLRAVDRAVPFAAVARAVREIIDLGNIDVHVDLIAGLPEDDMRSFARSLDEAHSLGAKALQLGFLKLLPGSALRAQARALGIVHETDAPYEVLRTPRMSFAELCHLKDVETLVEWYLNSGRYALTMRALTQGRSAFACLSDMARAFRHSGAFDAERGEKARAASLLHHVRLLLGARVSGALLTHDLLCAGRRADLPDALAFEETAAQRALLRERFHPVRGQSIREYPLDVLAFRDRGELLMEPCALLYEAPRAGNACHRI